MHGLNLRCFNLAGQPFTQYNLTYSQTHKNLQPLLPPKFLTRFQIRKGEFLCSTRHFEGNHVTNNNVCAFSASFLCNMVLDGIAYSYGILLNALMEHFGEGKGLISLVRFMKTSCGFLCQYGCETDFYPLDKNQFSAKLKNHV